jgi:hypothetical protein
MHRRKFAFSAVPAGQIARAAPAAYKAAVQQPWTDHYLWTSDNVRLHYRDFPGGREGQPGKSL